MATKKSGGFDFEIFGLMEGKSRRGGMSIQITKQGLYISTKASKFLTKEHAEIGYDEKKKAIAIQPSEKTDISRKLLKSSSGRLIISKELIRLIQKDAGDQKKFPCRWDEKEKMLIFDLKGEK